MATYEAYVTLGDASVAVSTVKIALSVTSEMGDVLSPIALLRLIVPPGTDSPEHKPRMGLMTKPDAHDATSLEGGEETRC